MAMYRMHVIAVLALAKNGFVETGVPPANHLRRVPGHSPSTCGDAAIRAASLEPRVRLAKNLGGIFARSAEASDIPFVPDFVVVDPFAVSGRKRFAEPLKRPRNRS